MADKICDETLIRRARGVMASEIDGEYLIMSLEQGSYIALRDVSARIWELLEDPCPVGSLRETLLREYEVDGETCSSELASFLEKMSENRLVELGPAV
jgi:hypothetical protein